MPAPTVDRVRRQTAQAVNERIDDETDARLTYYEAHPGEVDGRLAELDAEWDVERLIETEAAGTIMAGLALGMGASRKWFLLPLFASSMLLLHTTRGNYPLLPLFRRLGVRTTGEIARERQALQRLRGDFDALEPAKPDAASAGRAFEMARPRSAPPASAAPAH